MDCQAGHSGEGLGAREMLVALVVLIVIGAAVSLNFMSVNVDSESRVQHRQLGSLQEALSAFNRDVGRYPSEAEGLGALWTVENPPDGWMGPYLDPPIRADRWGRRLVYRPPSTDGKPMVLESLGADGIAGPGDDVRR